MRRIEHHYIDPVDQIWLETARRVGLAIARSGEVYASTDGRGSLHLGTAETLDPDDCLAQMIYHELCHSLIEGPDAFARPDWGLDNTSDRDQAREHACLRLQAALASEYGLRAVLAPTTDFRTFYDALPADPLDPRGTWSSVAAVFGLQRVDTSPWSPHLRQALEATAAVARTARDFTPAAAAADADASLLSRVEDDPGRHPTGVRNGPSAELRCGTCAWAYRGGRGAPVLRCHQADGMRVAPELRACVRWEPLLDCQACGACCREAYHSVTISRRAPVVRQHPELVVIGERYVEMRRVPSPDPWPGGMGSDTRCAALAGDAQEPPYACAIYDDRPRPCRDLERGGAHCLTARRRVGLSR